MFLPSADVFCPPQRTENQACFKRALLFTLALCAMMEGVPWDVADDRSSMTCTTGRARWGVLRLRVEGVVVYTVMGAGEGCWGRFVR